MIIVYNRVKPRNFPQHTVQLNKSNKCNIFRDPEQILTIFVSLIMSSKRKQMNKLIKIKDDIFCIPCDSNCFQWLG